MVDVIVGEVFTDYSDHPRKLVTLNQNSNQQAPDATSFFPVGGMPTASSLAWKTSLESQDAGVQQIKGVALYLIDRGVDIRQAIDRCSNIWASCRALVMVSSSIRLTAWLQNSKKRAERSERLMYEQVTAIISALVICIIVCLSWAVNPSIDNAITYWRQKCQRTEAGERGNYWHAGKSAWCCCARCKIHEGVSWCLRSWKWCSAWWCCRWSSSVAHQQSVSRCVKPPPPPAWIMQPPPTGRHRWTGLFHPRRGWSSQKQLEKEPKYINEQCRWNCPYRWATHAIIMA